jgi:hypothetical protein
MERGVVADMGAYGHDLEFGVFIEPAARSVDQVVALSVLAEEAGYDLVSYNDHPYSPRSLDALALMPSWPRGPVGCGWRPTCSACRCGHQRCWRTLSRASTS